MFVFDMYPVFSVIVLAQITDSYDTYIIDKNGRITKPLDVVHIDSKYMSAALRENIFKRLSEYLRRPRTTLQHTNQATNNEEKTNNHYEIRDSPVEFSNGRYILDLDTIDFIDLKNVDNKPIQPDEDTDSNEISRDYDYIGPDRFTSKTIPWRKLKRLSKYIMRNKSLRKHNRLLGDEKYFKSRDLSDSNENKIKKKKKYNQKKRFKIINNSKLKKKKIYHHNDDDSWEKDVNKIIKIKPSYDSDYYNPVADQLSSSSEEERHKKRKKHRKKKKKDSDDEVYLQGNLLIKFQPTQESESVEGSEEERNSRRRLPHFLPKRYHWEPKDIHKLGYFWFNGPKGKYPDPVLAT